jgi:Icc-related predicted phosphoesterase
MHSPPLNTVFGSSSGSAELTPVLDQFPEAIVFSGHSHQTLNNDKSIYQNKFTAINDGCNTEGRAEAIVAVVQNNGDVLLYRWNSRDNVLFVPDWLIKAPHDGSQFIYK